MSKEKIIGFIFGSIVFVLIFFIMLSLGLYRIGFFDYLINNH